MPNKWTAELREHEGSVNYDYDSYAADNCMYTPSPYFNWIFANKSNGVPKNAGVLFFSIPKAGKSLSIYAFIEEMHRLTAHLPEDERPHALYYNTEHRGQLQHGLFKGIDRERMHIYDTNDPVEIFDDIEKRIKPKVQDGMPIGIIAIDSMNNIMGIKRGDADSVADHLIGDKALTIQTGMEKLVPFVKRNRILLLGTCQMRANIGDTSYNAEKEKMAATWAAKHAFEYHVSLKRAMAAEDKKDVNDQTFENEEIKDARGNKILLAHKIYAKLEGNSLGQGGRAAIFTVDYKNGIINQHEEIFHLAKNTGIIQVAGASYTFGNQKWRGKKEVAKAILESPELAKDLVDAVKALDSDLST
jgi:hypothetical protein